MDNDFYIGAIALLLPVTACMLVTQVNPYHALVIRGILGAVAALVYALFGAADVALTEALVGTMLSITLYAVAVRSSLSMRVGILEPVTVVMQPVDTAPVDLSPVSAPLVDESSIDNLQTNGSLPPAIAPPAQPTPLLEELLTALRQTLSQYHMRLELVSYPSLQALETALLEKDIHTTCVPAEQFDQGSPALAVSPAPYYLQTRIRRLYDLMQSGLSPTLASLAYVRKDED